MKKLILLIQLCLVMPGLLIQAQNNQPYLGQDPPGMTAKRFPPDSLLGNSSWWWHGSPIFTADGLEMFWTEYVRYSPTNELATLFNMKVENNNWGDIHHPSFGNQNYFDKQYLFFNSWKPGDQGYNPYWISAAIIDSLRTIVGTRETEILSEIIKLEQNEPNPFSGETRISFRLKKPMTISLQVHNLFGKMVASLINNEWTDTGRHSVLFEPGECGLPSGIYTCSLITEKGKITQKMVLK